MVQRPKHLRNLFAVDPEGIIWKTAATIIHWKNFGTNKKPTPTMIRKGGAILRRLGSQLGLGQSAQLRAYKCALLATRHCELQVIFPTSAREGERETSLVTEMAESTVLSMARSMLGGAISKAASAAAAEISLLIGVRKDIWFIKDELETMRAFLEIAEAMKKKHVLLKVWAKQVRELSYNIEDCLGEFMVHVGSQSLLQQLLKLKDRHRIAMQIHDLKSRVEEVSIRNTRYNLIKTEASGTIDEVDSNTEDVRNHSSRNIDEAELVGFSKPKTELIKLIDIKNKEGHAKVICIVGMGGLGKTTLARKTYESKGDIVNNFLCFAWITVSQSFIKIEMLKDMIKQLLGDESLKNHLKRLEGKEVQVGDLANYLTEELTEKRYFIILDGLWTIDAWEWITNIALPQSNNKGSRVIVTTRDVGLAKKCTSESLVYHLEALQVDDATNLLLRKSGKTHENIKNDESMKAVVTKIVKKCGCLPLALLTIGGMLATKIETEWEDIYKQIPSELETNPTLEAMRRIVTLSYNHLPSHLKSCFLYLSIFPEDFEIERRRLVERWISEGFVIGRVGMTIEEVGKGYFHELINRSMIQPSSVNMEGRAKSCRVHDVMRDVMVSIARDENFVYLAGENVSSAAEENFRHVAYHDSKCVKIGMDWSHVRSLSVFGERPFESSPPLRWASLRMLRFLDIEEDAKLRITKKDMNDIGLLRHLKYVNVHYTLGVESYTFKLPRSIGKVQGLQTLRIRNIGCTTLPAEISELRSLRSLCCTRTERLYRKGCKGFLTHALLLPLVSPTSRNVVGVGVPRGINNLKELQILKVVDIKRTSSIAIKELEELTQLRKLSVSTGGASEKKYEIFCAAIEKLSSLCSLGMEAGHFDYRGNFTNSTLEWLHSVSSPPPHLRSVRLAGFLGMMPAWVRNLLHLVKIWLAWSQLEEDGKTLEILGALPNVMLLGLYQKSYVGEKLVFAARAFPKLRKLDIAALDELKEVRFEEGTSPQMEMVYIRGCRLESGITGIRHLPKLRETSLSYKAKVAKLGLLQGEVDAHPNHPVLRLLEDWSEHDLRGDVVQGSDTAQVESAAEESSLLPEPAPAAGESLQVQVVPMMNDSGDDLLYTYNSC